MGQSWHIFVVFCSFLFVISKIQIEKSIDGVLGIRTQGHRMVVADETAELFLLFLLWILFRKNWRRIKRAVFVAQLREQLLQTPIADPNKF